MKIKDVIDTIVTALSADAFIKDYCQANFNKDPNIIVGIDFQNPPIISDYPAIVIYDVKTEREISRIKYYVSIGVAVDDNEVTQAGQLKTYKAFIETLELKELVEILISQKFTKVIQKADSIPIENFPVSVASTTFLIECPLPRRNEREPV